MGARKVPWRVSVCSARTRRVFFSGDESTLAASSNLKSRLVNLFSRIDKPKHRLSMELHTILDENMSVFTPREIAFLYQQSCKYNIVLDRSVTKKILKIVTSDKNAMQFTSDELKDILHGHRYLQDGVEVRRLLKNILPSPESERSMTPLSPRMIGLSLYGLQNMTAYHIETRQVIEFLCNHLRQCSKPLDGMSLSGALHGLRCMNCKEPEVLLLLKELAKKIRETPHSILPSGLSRSYASLLYKTDTKNEVAELIAALNCHLEKQYFNMSVDQVCRALNGLQSMSLGSNAVLRSIELFNQRLMCLRPTDTFSPQSLSMAFCSLRELGCQEKETSNLLSTLTSCLNRLTEPLGQSELKRCFTCLRNMSHKNHAVLDALTSLTDRLIHFIESGGSMSRNFPVYTLKFMTHMRSNDIAVRNFLGVLDDVLQSGVVRLTESEYTECLSGMQNMSSSDPIVCEVVSSLNNCLINGSKSVFTFDETCHLLKGISNMSTECSAILDIIETVRKNIAVVDIKNVSKPIRPGLLGHAMLSLKNKSASHVSLSTIYSKLLLALEKWGSTSHPSNAPDLRTSVFMLSSLVAIPPSDDELFERTSKLFISMFFDKKVFPVTGLDGRDLSMCLFGISSRTSLNRAADTLLMRFMLSFSPSYICSHEIEFKYAMARMSYPFEKISQLISDVKNPEPLKSLELISAYQEEVSLDALLSKLSEGIMNCEKGDSLDVLWAGNLLDLLKTVEISEFKPDQIGKLLIISGEISEKFFASNKREIVALRQKVLELSSQVLQGSSSRIVSSYEDFSKVFVSTQSFWRKSGNKYGERILELVLESLRRSGLNPSIPQVVGTLKILKHTNSDHPQVGMLLSTLTERLAMSSGVEEFVNAKDFASALRGMRYFLKTTEARKMLSKLLASANNANLELDVDDLMVAMCGVKNCPSGYKEVAEVLDFFQSQTCLNRDNNICSSQWINALSCLRFMNSTERETCALIEKIEERIRCSSTPSHLSQDLLCDFVNFLNHKRCADNSAIASLRDSFIHFLWIAARDDNSVFSVKITEHLIAFKAKRTDDPEMESIFANLFQIATSSEFMPTPYMYVVSFLGLDVLPKRNRDGSTRNLCRRIKSSEIELSIQQLMLALSALESSSSGLTTNELETVINSLCLKSVAKSSVKVKFASLLAVFRSLAEMSKSTSSTNRIYSTLQGYIKCEKLTHHRIALLLQTLQAADLSQNEIREMLHGLLSKLKDIREEKADPDSMQLLFSSLENMDSDDQIVQDIEREVIQQNSVVQTQYARESSGDVDYALSATSSN